MDERIISDILSLIKKNYEDLDSPSFFFVEHALSKLPYEHIVREIERFVAVTEDTDPNDDVSFGFILNKDNSQWVLRVSMVGPYGLLMRIGNDGSCEVLSVGLETLTNLEKQIIGILLKQNIVMLDKEALSVPVTLKLLNTDVNNVRVYQALFTDSDILPWLGRSSESR